MLISIGCIPHRTEWVGHPKSLDNEMYLLSVMNLGNWLKLPLKLVSNKNAQK